MSGCPEIQSSVADTDLINGHNQSLDTLSPEMLLLLVPCLFATASAAGIPAVIAPRQQAPSVPNFPDFLGSGGAGDLDAANAWASQAEKMYSDPRYLSLESILMSPAYLTFNPSQLQSVNAGLHSLAIEYFSDTPGKGGGAIAEDDRAATITRASPTKATLAEPTQPIPVPESNPVPGSGGNLDSLSRPAASDGSRASAAIPEVASSVAAGTASAASPVGSAVSAVGSAASSGLGSLGSAATSATSSAATSTSATSTRTSTSLEFASHIYGPGPPTAIGTTGVANGGVSNGVSLVGAALMVVAALI